MPFGDEIQVTIGDQATAPPARGTRPRNRRGLIIDAARRLFYERGFDHVGMGDIADAVAIGPSALYRHFPGKQQLLFTVISDSLRPIHELVADVDLADRATAVPVIARIALDHRELGVLWQREARHVTAEDFRELRSELRAIVGGVLAARTQTARPDLSAAAADLVAWTIAAIVMSASFHHLQLPRTDYEALLAELLEATLDAELPADFVAAPEQAPMPTLVPSSRREALLAQAVRLFAEQGYTGVGNEDVGAAVGITGPSIYNHFGSKLELLHTALERGAAGLFLDLASTYATAATATEALRRLIGHYVRFAIEHHNLLDLLITETQHLPEDERHRISSAQHAYVDEWVHLLRSVHPGLDPTAARIRVLAALAIANNAGRTPHLRRNPDVPAAMEQIAARMLHV